MTINIYLETNKNVKNLALWIYIRGIGPTIKIHTGQYINAELWDVKKQRPKEFKGHLELESYLTTLKEAIKKEWRTIISDKESVDNPTLKKRFIDVVENILLSKKSESKNEKKDNNPFYKSYDEFVESKKYKSKHRTIQKFNTLKSHLIRFEKEKKYKLSYDTINAEFFDKFTSFLMTSLKHTNNSVGKYISVIKSFMFWSIDRGKTKNLDFKKFEVWEEKTDIIYLTYKELMKLYNFNFSDNLSLSQVRDVFCFGCFTGQRISDLEKLTWDDIKNNVWNVRTVKTRDNLEIPLIKKAQDILKRYKGRNKPLPIISQQKTNQYIKIACQNVGLNDKIRTVRYRGSEIIEKIQPKYLYITTHTARRTFVTLSLEKRLRPEIVMEITGHTDYKTMLKYLKITSQVIKSEMLKAWKD